MEQIFKTFLLELAFGELQSYKNMGIIPLFSPVKDGPDYILMKEALEKNLITITEVDKSGNVPELKVINSSETYVLLLDGEEVMGAKQNRVLNTTILLKGLSETVIPVSCTEQGRWRYTTDRFSHSDVIMARKARAGKAKSVMNSLIEDRGYASDQGEVWNQIHELHLDAGVSSATGAMKDIYTAKSQDLNEFAQCFECLPGQRGSFVFIDGQPAGLDLVSREEAYANLHQKLVKSYAMDTFQYRTPPPSEPPSVDKAKQFIQEALNCKESRYPSTGEGFDCRFEAEGVVGSALMYDNSIIHLVLFKLDRPDSQRDIMSGYRHRRNAMHRRMESQEEFGGGPEEI